MIDIELLLFAVCLLIAVSIVFGFVLPILWGVGLEVTSLMRTAPPLQGGGEEE